MQLRIHLDSLTKMSGRLQASHHNANAKSTMSLDHYITLGRSGLRVSPFCLGATGWSSPRSSAATCTPGIPTAADPAASQSLRRVKTRCAACRRTTLTCIGCITGTCTRRSKRRWRARGSRARGQGALPWRLRYARVEDRRGERHGALPRLARVHRFADRVLTRKAPTASWPQPCRLPKCKSAFRACAPLLGQYGQHAAFHDRRRQQSSPASLAAYVELSWSALQQSRFGFGIFIYCPMICQGLIHIEEIGPPALESSYHIGSRDIVAALPHSARDPTQRELRRVLAMPQVYQFRDGIERTYLSEGRRGPGNIRPYQRRPLESDSGRHHIRCEVETIT